MTALARYFGLDSFIPGAGLLNGVTGLAQLGAAAPDLLHFARRETPLIRQLQHALQKLEQAFETGTPETIEEAALEAQTKLEAILKDPAKHKENFKNYATVSRWSSYLRPLQELKEEIETFTGPHLGCSPKEMEALLPSALTLVNAEVEKQKGVVSKVMESAWDTVATRVQESAQECVGSSTTSKKTTLPPLLKLQKNIAVYNSYSSDFLPEVIEDNLRLELHKLDQSSPLFYGVEEFVLEETKGDPLIDEIAFDLSAFILDRALKSPDDQFHEYLFHTALEVDAVDPLHVTSKEEQIAWGKAFLEGMEKERQTNEIDDDNIQILWSAISHLDELGKLSKAIKALEDSSDSSLSSLAEKIDQTLALFETNSHLSGDILQILSNTMVEWLSSAYTLAKPHLELQERQEMGEILTQAKQQIHKGNHVESLKLIKKGLSLPKLAQHMGKIDKQTRPQSPLDQMVANFEKQTQPSPAHNSEQNWLRELNIQREGLVKNLAYYSTFTVMASMCGITEPDLFERQYASIHGQLEGLEGTAKKQKFKSLLHATIDDNSDFGFFKKLYVKIVVSFTLTLTNYLAKPFAKSLMSYLHSLAHRPYENPLGTDHLSPVQNMNNAFVAYLQAETRIENDPEGLKGGALGKRQRIAHFLDQPDLNGGYAVKDLVNKVVSKAIKEFLNLKQLSEKAKGWNDRLVEWRQGVKNPFAYCFAFLGTGALQTLNLIPRAIFPMLDWVYSKGLKRGAKTLLTKFDIVNTVLESASNAIYDDAQYTSALDGVILDQLKEVEHLLEQEGGTLRLYEGDNGKRLFEELTSNLFAVLDKRGNLTPHQQKKRDNLVAQTKKALEDMADEKLKASVQELLIFVYQSLRTENQMNGLLVTLLKKTNEALLPRKHPIHELYSEAEVNALAMQIGKSKPEDQDLIAHFVLQSGKIATTEMEAAKKELKAGLERDPTYGECVLYFSTRIATLAHKVTRNDLEEALKEKYQQTEDEIHTVLERILKKSVEDVVVVQAETLLKTPEEALLSHLTWIENQFIHQKAIAQTTKPTYIETMRQQLQTIDSASESALLPRFEELRSTHLTMMHQMQAYLNTLLSKEGSHPSIDRKIHAVYDQINSIFPLLKQMSEYMIEYQATKDEGLLIDLEKALNKLEMHMDSQANRIEGMKHSLQISDGSVGEKARKWKNWVIQEAAEPCLKHVTEYVHGRLNKRAQEAVLMYKDPNTYHALLRHVVLLGYLHKKPMPSMGGTERGIFDVSPTLEPAVLV